MGAKRGIELEHVVEVAATIADADGLDRVTLAGVAAALGVQSPSLYAHVAGLAGLRRELALHAVTALDDAIDAAMTGRTGIEAVVSLAYAYREFGEAHPGLFAALSTTPSRDVDREGFDAFTDPVVTILRHLADLGLGPQEAVDVIRAVRSAVHGFVSLEASGGFALPADIDASFDVLVEIVTAGILARIEQHA